MYKRQTLASFSRCLFEEHGKALAHPRTQATAPPDASPRATPLTGEPVAAAGKSAHSLTEPPVHRAIETGNTVPASPIEVDTGGAPRASESDTLAGSFEAALALTSQEAVDTLVRDHVSRVLRVPAHEIHLDDPLSEYGFDSLTLGELIGCFTCLLYTSPSPRD